MTILRVLVTAPPILSSIDDYQEALGRLGVEVVTPDFDFSEALTEKELERLLGDIDGILCGDDELTHTVLSRAPRLRVISKWGTGIDSIDAEAARELGIKVCRVPDAFANPVADTVLAYMLMYARQIVKKDNCVRDGRWEKVDSYSLSELSLGIIGVGHIGTAVARRACAFEMSVIGNDIRDLTPEDFAGANVELVGLEELLERSDFVSLNCDLNETSRRMIGAMELQKMKSTAYLINTARGLLIDQCALTEALEQGLIAGAALDVFESEPLPMDSPLRKMKNVLFSPHNSNGSPQVFKRVHRKSLNNLLLGLGRGGM